MRHPLIRFPLSLLFCSFVLQTFRLLRTLVISFLGSHSSVLNSYSSTLFEAFSTCIFSTKKTLNKGEEQQGKKISVFVDRIFVGLFSPLSNQQYNIIICDWVQPSISIYSIYWCLWASSIPNQILPSFLPSEPFVESFKVLV